ncbi:MAG TPA: D-ribose pyranase [Ruminiclostridium sp.]
MKKDGILNMNVIKAIAAIGHKHYLVICDAGLPLPKGVEIIDLSVVRGVPSFLEVLDAVSKEFVIESFIYASEAHTKNPALPQKMSNILKDLPEKDIPHEEFKCLTCEAYTIIRTGECSPYSNVILVGGVNF